MNAERRRTFAHMLADAEIEGATNPQVFLVREVFYQPASDFVRGVNCSHVRALVHRLNSAGRDIYNYFCQVCGARMSEFLPYRSLSPSQKQNAYGQDFYDQLYEARAACQRQLHEFFAGRWWDAYNAYLQTEHWRNLRDRVLYRDGYQCQLNLWGCTQAATQVHHLTYERVTRERLPDLIAVCNTCHEQHHGRAFYDENGHQ